MCTDYTSNVLYQIDNCHAGSLCICFMWSFYRSVASVFTFRRGTTLENLERATNVERHSCLTRSGATTSRDRFRCKVKHEKRRKKMIWHRNPVASNLNRNDEVLAGEKAPSVAHCGHAQSNDSFVIIRENNDCFRVIRDSNDSFVNWY